MTRRERTRAEEILTELKAEVSEEYTNIRYANRLLQENDIDLRIMQNEINNAIALTLNNMLILDTERNYDLIDLSYEILNICKSYREAVMALKKKRGYIE